MSAHTATGDQPHHHRRMPTTHHAPAPRTGVGHRRAAPPVDDLRA